MVVICQSVLDAIHAHGNAHRNVEVCGVLVGEVRDVDGKQVTFATAMIQGEGATNQAGAVTFTAETWTHIQQTMDNQYEDQRIVGWYHTHPNFGIFLSEMDLFIQENFFDFDWQIAYVYDPIRNEQGLFGWQDGKTVPTDFEIDKDTDEVSLKCQSHQNESLKKWHHRVKVLLAVMLMFFMVAMSWWVVLPLVIHE